MVCELYLANKRIENKQCYPIFHFLCSRKKFAVSKACSLWGKMGDLESVLTMAFQAVKSISWGSILQGIKNSKQDLKRELLPKTF